MCTSLKISLALSSVSTSEALNHRKGLSNKQVYKKIKNCWHYIVHSGQANTQILRHEAYWVLNTINTRATVSPDTCDGRWCPFTATNGLAFAVELYAPKDFPAVSNPFIRNSLITKHIIYALCLHVSLLQLRGTLYWRVYGSDNRMLMCFRVPIALTR